MARMLTFSRSVEARDCRNLAANTEKPTARMEMGMADSMPWPSFRAMYVAAAEKTIDHRNPWSIDRGVTSGISRSAGMTGW
jgi:hypothetical protein